MAENNNTIKDKTIANNNDREPPQEENPSNGNQQRQVVDEETGGGGGGGVSQSNDTVGGGRTPFTNLSQVDADLALARTLQEQVIVELMDLFLIFNWKLRLIMID